MDSACRGRQTGGSPILTVFPGDCTPDMPAPPPPDPEFVLRGTQTAVHSLYFYSGAQGQGRPLLLSG